MYFSFSVPFFLHELRIAFSYIPVVLLLSIVPLIGGLLLGMLLALSRVYRIPFFHRLSQTYVIVVRSIPVLLQMLLAYFLVRAVYSASGWSSAGINKLVVVLFTLALSAAGFLSENIRSALLSVENGQYEAALSVGMTRWSVFWHVVLPQSLPVAIPMIGSSFIVIIKGSSAAYLLGVIEMIQATSMETAGNYRYLEAYCATAVIYWGLTICVERIITFAETHVRLHIKGGVL